MISFSEILSFVLCLLCLFAFTTDLRDWREKLVIRSCVVYYKLTCSCTFAQKQFRVFDFHILPVRTSTAEFISISNRIN